MTDTVNETEFQQEASELIEALEEALLTLESSPDQQEVVDRAFRAMHTLKGSGALLGYSDLAAFVHELESVYDALRQNIVSVTPELVSVSLKCVDHIRVLVGRPGELSPTERATETELLDQLEALRKRSPAQQRTNATGTLSRYEIVFEPGPSLIDYGLNPADIFDELRTYGPCRFEVDASGVQVVDELDVKVLRLKWRIHLESDVSEEDLAGVFLLVPGDTHYSVRTVAKGIGAGATSQSKGSGGNARVSEEAVRVSTAKLDALVGIVGELVIAQSRLQQHVRATTDENLRDIVDQLERLTTDLRDGALGIRMRPVGQVFARFHRVTRDLAESVGKQVVFETEGDSVEIDKGVLDHLVDPIVHLLRNAMDHGIEPADRRRAAGKPEMGRVALRARQQYGSVVIEVSDDGAGMDPERIMASARRKGLLRDDEVVSSDRALELVLLPGFSTAAAVSDLSGRGVGLDVVKRVVDGLSGQLRIQSEVGMGTTFVFSLPLTLSIIEGLMVKVGDETYVLPLAQVDRVLEVDANDPTYRAGQGLFRHQDQNVPFIRLREWFASPGADPQFEKVVVTQTASHPLAYIVDDVLGHSQIVVKELIGAMQYESGVSAATILGDGRVALILDANKLLEHLLQKKPAHACTPQAPSADFVGPRAQFS